MGKNLRTQEKNSTRKWNFLIEDVMGLKTRPIGFHNITRCPARFYSFCANLERKCSECVTIQGKPTEFVIDEISHLDYIQIKGDLQ